MFEAAEVGNAVDKTQFQSESVKIREALLAVQRQLANADFSVVIVIAGVEGAGKSETVNLLLAWMDARGIQTHSMWNPSDEEIQRPEYWRYWRVLPPKGRISIFFGSWYTAPINDRVAGKMSEGDMGKSLTDVCEFESMLTRENVLVLKFWLHIPKKVQKQRLEKLEANKLTRWRVHKTDWKHLKKYDKIRLASEHVLSNTNTAEAPWHIVEATDARYRYLTVTRTLLDALQRRVAESQNKIKAPGVPDHSRPQPVNILTRLDMSLAMGGEEYERKRLKYSGKLYKLSVGLYEKKRSLIAVFEGPDAAGKGGAIRRLTGAMDPRIYQVIPVSAPTDEELAHPYLWRFWRNTPRYGRVKIFDRSWYGRVLVERIEGFCSTSDWQRAYEEINNFEGQLARAGTYIVKFWLNITPEVQLNRFKDREVTPYKQYKLTEDDWRNREKFDAYIAAACDMIEKTGTEHAPWVPVEANDKNWARIKVLSTVCDLLEKRLDGDED